MGLMQKLHLGRKRSGHITVTFDEKASTSGCSSFASLTSSTSTLSLPCSAKTSLSVPTQQGPSRLMLADNDYNAVSVSIRSDILHELVSTEKLDGTQGGEEDAVECLHDDSTPERTQIVNVLLLGSVGSGKSTLLKQLQLLYGSDVETRGLTELCRVAMYMEIIHLIKQCLDIQANLLGGDEQRLRLRKLRLSPVLAWERRLQQQIHSHSRGRESGMNGLRPSLQQGISKEVMAARQLFSALQMDIAELASTSRGSLPQDVATQRLISSISRICSLEYEPTEGDVIYVKLSSGTLQNQSIPMSPTVSLRIHARTELGSDLAKGGPVLEQVRCILYTIDASGYESHGSGSLAQLDESFRLLEELCRQPELQRAVICVVLTKNDVLRGRLNGKSYKIALSHLRTRIEQITTLSKHVNGQQPRILTYVTQATDKTQVSLMFESLKDACLNESEDIGA